MVAERVAQRKNVRKALPFSSFSRGWVLVMGIVGIESDGRFSGIRKTSLLVSQSGCAAQTVSRQAAGLGLS